MPETYDQNPKTKSKYDGEAELQKKYAKLGARITDNVPHKLFGLKTTDEEYWGLREILNEKEVDILLVKDGALYPVEIKKGVSPTKPTKNFNVLEKYRMPIMRGMVIDNTDAVRAINDDAFSFPVSLLGA